MGMSEEQEWIALVRHVSVHRSVSVHYKCAPDVSSCAEMISLAYEKQGLFGTGR